MAMKVSLGEVFDAAIQIERRGYDFYRKAAKATSDKVFQKELAALSKMEKGHAAVFTKLKEELAGGKKETKQSASSKEAARYLEAFAAGTVFNITDDASLALSELPTVHDILIFAIGRERDSILFYVGMREMISDKSGIEKISRIIKEEMDHVALLNRKLQAL